jgi:hypothetical protein
MKIEVPVGEIIDKLSILLLKKTNIIDPEKLKNINKEYEYLHEIVFNQLKIDKEDFTDLFNINQILWDVEDNIRIKERNKEFDEKFIELARLVYWTNDKRAILKLEINKKYNSNFIEEKSYESY